MLENELPPEKQPLVVLNEKTIDELIAESKRLRQLSGDLNERTLELDRKIEEIAERQRRLMLRNPEK